MSQSAYLKMSMQALEFSKICRKLEAEVIAIWWNAYCNDYLHTVGVIRCSIHLWRRFERSDRELCPYVKNLEAYSSSAWGRG